MATGSKKKEERKGPKAYEVIIGALLSIILGVLLAVIYLMVQPVEEVDELPAESARDRRTVYFVEGEVGSAAQFNWRPKLGALTGGNPGTIELAEQELNQWAAVQFPDLDDDDPEEGIVSIAPRSLNFRVYDGVLQVSSEVELDVFGVGKTLRVQAHGDFVERNGRFVFEPERFYLGGFQVPHETLVESIAGRIYGTFEVTEDLLEGWDRLSQVTVVDNRLILEVP